MHNQIKRSNFNLYGRGLSSSNKLLKNIGSRINRKSKMTKILHYLVTNGPSTKYELITNVLGIDRTKKEARGYYSVSFQNWIEADILKHDPKTFKYILTIKGCKILVTAWDK